ncbi:hypothetical protein [Niabella beijingensis]|uniref:hypothetical protein n=1 Tax=Niabella beijingensis TaxID=2872700 RepID=UPI001CBACD42|nr:hypothetical protein [Niabella beijingensis]MBZ4188646.1 hypothetical protein [Niabella beijingensis]
MTTAAIRNKLQDYIRFADDKKVKAIYTLLEEEITTEYQWFEDKEFVAALDKEYEAAVSGKAKTHSSFEIQKELQQLRHKRIKAK